MLNYATSIVMSAYQSMSPCQIYKERNLQGNRKLKHQRTHKNPFISLQLLLTHIIILNSNLK